MRGLELATCDRALPPAGEAPEWVHLLPPGKMQGRDGRAYELADPPGLILAHPSGGINLPVGSSTRTTSPRPGFTGRCLRRAGSRSCAPTHPAFGAGWNGPRPRAR